MTAERLVLDGIVKCYPGCDVLTGLDLALAPGEVVSVRGASGTGKSTLLNIAGLLDRPDRGRLHLDGQRVDTLSTTRRAQLRARRIGFVFQGFHLLPEFSVLENVLMPTRCGSGALGMAKAKAAALLERVGLAAKTRGPVTTLSGGEAQRVALCRALVTQPGLVLADEPTGNLDPATASIVLELLLELARDHDTSVLLVTHDPDIAARADRRLELRSGTLHAD